MKVFTLGLWLFCVIGFAGCEKNSHSPTGPMRVSNQNDVSKTTDTRADSDRGVLGSFSTKTATTNDAGIDNSGGSKSSKTSSGGSNH